MPELPDIELYLHSLRPRVDRCRVNRVRISSPFVLRTVDPSFDEIEGRQILGVSRVGKRIVLELEADLFIAIHLMIAGRLRWSEKPAKPPPKIGLASIEFDHGGTLLLVESSTQKRAGIWMLRGRASVVALGAGGVDVRALSPADFAAKLKLRNRTLKRALTDPALFDGIGNAYSDEILHAARLSPVKLTARLTDEECARLHAVAGDTLTRWSERLIAKFAGKFPGPGDVTAFRPDFAAHGRFGMPCPVCQTAIQRIRYAENETNYCPRCQTAGKVLADRSLSRLLKQDWPGRVEDWE